MTDNRIRIWIDGHPADLFGLSLLFCPGTHPDYEVNTNIQGVSERGLHRITNEENKRTYVTGRAVEPIIAAAGPQAAEMISINILRPLNGYGILASSSFVPVRPVAADLPLSTGPRHFVFGRAPQLRPVTSMGRHPNLKERMPERLQFIESSHIAQRAFHTLGRPPSWSRYYRLLEDIAKECGTTINKLHTTGFMTKSQKTEFTKAANSSLQLEEDPRHGLAKMNGKVNQMDLMNLLEARELVRTFVSNWIDGKCGNRMGREVVEHGGLMRFGIGQ